MSELKPCPFCGGEAETRTSTWNDKNYKWTVQCKTNLCMGKVGCAFYRTEAEAIEAWNTRAAMEFDNWFYLPKPKEPIVEVTETTNAWDGTKVRTDVFYQVRKQAIVNWARELDENIIKRICEVWNTQAERTCKNNAPAYLDFLCSECGFVHYHSEANDTGDGNEWNYCPNCGARVTPKNSETTPKVVSE